MPTQGRHFGRARTQENLHQTIELWCGDRRTVVGREGPVFARLELGGFFDVPHRVSINKLAGYGFSWNRIGNF